MGSIGSSIQLAFRWISFLPAFCLRLYYTIEKLQSLIMTDVAPRGGQVVFDLGHPDQVEIRIRICNFSPFKMTVDYLKVEIWGIGNPLKIDFYESKEIKPSCFEDIYVSGLEGAHAFERLKNHDSKNMYLNIYTKLSCKIRKFEKGDHNLQMVHVEIQNIDPEKHADYLLK